MSALTFDIKNASTARAAFTKVDANHPLADMELVQGALNTVAGVLKNAMAQAHVQRRNDVAEGKAKAEDKLTLDVTVPFTHVVSACGSGWGAIGRLVERLDMRNHDLGSVADAQCYNVNLKLLAEALTEHLTAAEFDPLAVTPTFASESAGCGMPEPMAPALHITFQY